MAELLHRRPDDLPGHTCFGLMHGTECPIHDCPVVRMARSRTREILIVEKDGRWFEAIADPLFDASGELVGAVHILVDITGQRETEMELGRLRQEFLHVSRVSSMGELTAALAHELNQPLTAILANAQAVQHLLSSGGNYSQEIEAALSDIIGEDRRASDIIQRIRRMIAKRPLDIKLVDLNTCIREVATLVNSIALARRVRVSLDLAPDLPGVDGDAVQLQQIMMNLLLNAIEAMTPAEISRRELKIRSVGLPSGRVQVSVEDTGPGLPPVDDATLFSTFYTTKPQGMGMGLSICRSILQNLGGRIRAEDRPGGGAVFRFELPAGGHPS